MLRTTVHSKQRPSVVDEGTTVNGQNVTIHSLREGSLEDFALRKQGHFEATAQVELGSSALRLVGLGTTHFDFSGRDTACYVLSAVPRILR